MKTILAISGSPSKNSSNTQLLELLKKTFANTYSIQVYDKLWTFPLFSPQLVQEGTPKNVEAFKQQLTRADAVIICTPEYVHNIPAVLKNMLEWITASGELAAKPVLPITFTPSAPRGQHAMRSLLASLQASDAKIVTEMQLYRDELTTKAGHLFISKTMQPVFSAALSLL